MPSWEPRPDVKLRWKQDAAEDLYDALGALLNATRAVERSESPDEETDAQRKLANAWDDAESALAKARGE